MPSNAISPPAYAKRLGVKVQKILAFINAGDLIAINLAANPHGRPRWKITPEAIHAFEASRAAQPRPAAKRRRKQPGDVGTYF